MCIFVCSLFVLFFLVFTPIFSIAWTSWMHSPWTAGYCRQPRPFSKSWFERTGLGAPASSSPGRPSAPSGLDWTGLACLAWPVWVRLFGPGLHTLILAPHPLTSVWTLTSMPTTTSAWLATASPSRSHSVRWGRSSRWPSDPFATPMLVPGQIDAPRWLLPSRGHSSRGLSLSGGCSLCT